MTDKLTTDAELKRIVEDAKPRPRYTVELDPESSLGTFMVCDRGKGIARTPPIGHSFVMELISLANSADLIASELLAARQQLAELGKLCEIAPFCHEGKASVLVSQVLAIIERGKG